MDHDAIVLHQESMTAYKECAFPLWFTAEYAVAIGKLEGLEQGLAMSWLKFGEEHFSSGDWKKGDAFIFLPSGAQRLARRRKNRHRNRRREAH